MKLAMEAFPEVEITEFTVAPQIEPEEGITSSRMVCGISANAPNDINAFSKFIDEKLQLQNVYYRDLIEGKVLRSMVIRSLKKNAFNAYMSLKES